MKQNGTTFIQEITVTLSSGDSLYLQRVSAKAKGDIELILKKGFLDYVNGYMVIHRDGTGNLRKTERHLFD